MKVVALIVIFSLSVLLVGACTMSSSSISKTEIEIQVWFYDEFFTVSSCDHLKENCMEKTAELLKKSMVDPNYRDPQFRIGLNTDVSKYIKSDRSIKIVIMGSSISSDTWLESIAHLRDNSNIKIIHSSLQRHSKPHV